VVIAAVVVLVILLVWYGHRVFSPTANVENELTDKKQAFMQKIAKEAGPNADISKINQADRDIFVQNVRPSGRTPEEILKQYIANNPVH
jgi:uncharacterized membrane protein YvbJ